MPWDVTPGVPAYAAAAATLGVELTVPELAQTVVLTRTQARSTAMPDAESLAAHGRRSAARWCCTWPSPASAALAADPGRRPTARTARSRSWPSPSQPREVVLRGTLADIADQVEAAGLRHTAVILVGRALGLRSDAACVAESHLYDARRPRPAELGGHRGRDEAP